jgi:plastocyanin
MTRTTTRARRLVVSLAAATLVLGGCAAEEPDEDPPPGQDQDTADDLESGDLEDGDLDDGDGATGDAEVEARNIAFQPSELTVAVGTTVTWTNADVVRHTVTSGAPGEADGTFDEPLAAEGSASITFDEPGTFAYHCDLHRNMTGEIVVE